MDRTLIAILGAGGIVMAVTAGVSCWEPSASSLKREERRYMHCRQCGRERPYLERLAEKPCPQCGAEGSVVPTKERVTGSNAPPSPASVVFARLLIEANVLAVVIILYLSARRRRAAEEEYLYMECGHCRQKLRYRSARIGQVGQCPRCRAPTRLPPSAPDESPTNGVPWWQPGRWWWAVKQRLSAARSSEKREDQTHVHET